VEKTSKTEQLKVNPESIALNTGKKIMAADAH
jgi:hypothetical protein